MSTLTPSDLETAVAWLAERPSPLLGREAVLVDRGRRRVHVSCPTPARGHDLALALTHLGLAGRVRPTPCGGWLLTVEVA